MNPQFDKPANLNLPPPIVEAPAQAPLASGEQKPIQAPEAIPVGPEMGQKQPATPPIVAMPQFTMPPLTTTIGSTVTSSSPTPSTNPVMADDADLIEKEWVTKAKAIVEKTKEDPHAQTKEITHLKSDYLKKRYNKTIKISE